MTGPTGGDPMDELMSQLANLQNAFGSADADRGALPVAQVVGSAGGGAVRVHAGGDLEFTAVEIDASVVDPNDVSVLEDLVLAAVRDAAEQLRRSAEANLGEMVGGALSGLSGLFGALGQGNP